MVEFGCQTDMFSHSEAWNENYGWDVIDPISIKRYFLIFPMAKFVITKIYGFSNFRFVRKGFKQLFGIMTTIIFRTNDYFSVWFFIEQSVLQTHNIFL